MPQFYGNSPPPLILIHGGAGPQDPKVQKIEEATSELVDIAKSGVKFFHNGQQELVVVSELLRKLEDCERFNAGIGSALQSDGLTRMTASLMDGASQSFSAAISVSYVQNPSKLALKLQDKSSRVLTSPGTELLARELGLSMGTTLVEKRIEKWLECYKKSPSLGDTVGVLFLSPDKKLVAGSSTGGRGFEFPGRVSDSGTVAGNYASPLLAVTVTGVGEEIVDDGVAVRMETRVRDGKTLKEASQLAYEEAQKLKRQYGWIAVDDQGNWAAAYTTAGMSFVIMDGAGSVIKKSGEIL